MEKKFTQGRWYINGQSSILSNIQDEGDIICFSPERWDASMENWDANAKLIAAAPINIEEHEKLVSHAEALLYWMEQYRPITMTAEKQAVNQLKQQIEKSKQAIKKALE